MLEHGWAYGHEGTALRRQKIAQRDHPGGGETAYRQGGHNRFTMRELLAPVEQTADLCGWTYLPPFVIHGTHALTRRRGIDRHADRLSADCWKVCGDRLDRIAAASQPRLNTINADLDAVLGRLRHAR